jgi:hypothetical protein
MTNDPIVSKLNEYISEQADRHLNEMKLKYNTGASSEVTQRFCSECKHCWKGDYHPAFWLCCSPCNGWSLVSGRPVTVENTSLSLSIGEGCLVKTTFTERPGTIES